MDKLKTKTIKGFAWIGTCQFVGQIISYSITIYVARILTPADYGLMGIAFLVISFSMLLNVLGFGSAIIQKEDVDQQTLSTVFWFSLILSVILAIVIYVSAPLIASFFNLKKVIPIIQLLSICFFAGSLKVIPANLLLKKLEFDKSAKMDFLSSLLTGLITLLLAMKGYGVYSLVYSYIFNQFFSNLLAYYYHPWYPSFSFQWSKARGMIWFGLRCTGSRILWYFHSKSDIFVAGKMLGDNMLGYYSMAFNLANMPTEKVSSVVNQVSFPVFSKLKNDIGQLKKYLLQITTLTAIVTFPMITIGILMAEELFIQILTEKWRMSIFPFRVLCFIGLIQSVRVIIGQACIALGEVSLLFNINILSIIIYPAAFYLGSFYGINGIATSWLFVYPIVSLYFMGCIFRILNLKWIEYIKAFQTPALGCFIIIIAVFSLKMIHPVQNQVGKLLVEIALPLVIYLFFILKAPEGTKIRENLSTFIKNKRTGLSIENE